VGRDGVLEKGRKWRLPMLEVIVGFSGIFQGVRIIYCFAKGHCITQPFTQLSHETVDLCLSGLYPLIRHTEYAIFEGGG
jgi:hypothetical protein